MFYLDEVRGNAAAIHGETAKHLRKVLRVEQGMHFEVSDRDRLWTAEISSLGKDSVNFTLLKELTPPASPVCTHLLASLIKFDHFEWTLEKSTELGVAKVTPVNALRSDKGLDLASSKRMDRWRRILLESGQQSRRLRPPELEGLSGLNQALATDAPIRLWLDETPGAPPILSALPPVRHQTDTVAILAGPEGGWDPRERELALQSGWSPVSLGPQILRAETAAIAALSIVNAAWLAP